VEPADSHSNAEVRGSIPPLLHQFYDLTRSVALTLAEIASHLSAELAKQVAFVDVPKAPCSIR